MKWDAVTGATGYKLHMSTDLGATWGTAVDTTVAEYTYQAVPENTLVLFKVCSVNAAMTSCNHWSGAWYDHRLKMPVSVGLGVIQ
jgi:hypothetical protein